MQLSKLIDMFDISVWLKAMKPCVWPMACVREAIRLTLKPNIGILKQSKWEMMREEASIIPEMTMYEKRNAAKWLVALLCSGCRNAMCDPVPEGWSYFSNADETGSIQSIWYISCASVDSAINVYVSINVCVLVLFNDCDDWLVFLTFYSWL